MESSIAGHQLCRYGSMTRGQDDNKIILNCVRKPMKNKLEKEARKGPNLKKFHKAYGNENKFLNSILT